MENNYEVENRGCAVLEALERAFPGKFKRDFGLSATTYVAGAEGSTAFDYLVYVRCFDTFLDVSASAPIRFSKETMGHKVLERANAYVNEANETGVCTVRLDHSGRLCVQLALFEDEEAIEEAVCRAIDCLDCNFLPLVQIVFDENANPEKCAFDAGRKLVAKYGAGIKELASAVHLKLNRCPFVKETEEGSEG